MDLECAISEIIQAETMTEWLEKDGCNYNYCNKFLKLLSDTTDFDSSFTSSVCSGAGCKPTHSASLELCQTHKKSHVFLCTETVWYDWHTVASKHGIYVGEFHFRYESCKIFTITNGIGYRKRVCQGPAVTYLCQF
jgi:hypothetical protein